MVKLHKNCIFSKKELKSPYSAAFFAAILKNFKFSQAANFKLEIKFSSCVAQAANFIN